MGLVGKRLEALDKEAKLTGAYQQDRPNDMVAELKAQLKSLIEEFGLAEAVEIFRLFQAKNLDENVAAEVLRLSGVVEDEGELKLS